MKKIITLCICAICNEVYGQKPGVDAFVRLPHVINYNFTARNVSYTPAVSAGLTFRYRGFFADVGSFIDNSDMFGHYTYFGSPLQTSRCPDNKIFVLNWFGEITRIPDQGENESLTIKTIGISPVIVSPIGKSNFAVAFTFGVAFSGSTTNLNSRIILNYALPLLK